MKTKGLNNNLNYNTNYNIYFIPHLLERRNKRDLEIEKIKQTIGDGKKVKKSEYPKICKKHYFGKDNITYFVIFIKNENIAKVISAWKTKGN